MPETPYERARRMSAETGTVGTSGSSHHDQMKNLVDHLNHAFQNDPNNGSTWEDMQGAREHLNAAANHTDASLKSHKAGDGWDAGEQLRYASDSVRNAVHSLRRLGVSFSGTPALDASDIAEGYKALNYR